ncbi:MAG: HD-GYP domain-containing protein [bacterium]|jgi:putative nucleotidyltransferase with HDIG domain
MAAKYQVYAYGSRKAFPAESLSIGTRLPFDVYVNEENVFRKLYVAGQLIGPEERAVLRRTGAAEAYVDAKDTTGLDLYLQRTSCETPANPEDPEACQEYFEHKRRYYQVDRTFLLPGSRVEFGIYLQCDLRLTPLVEAMEGEPGIIPNGISAAAGDVVIRNEDIPLYHRYLDTLLDGGAEVVPVPAEREKIRAVVIKEKSKAIIRDLIEDPRSGENIKKAVGLATQLTDSIMSSREIIHELISLNSYDLYTYTHSVNVAVLSVAIGVTHGMGRDDAGSLGVGALLHDIGKGGIPTEILNKPGKLSAPEFEIVKGHVVEGAKILQMHEAIPRTATEVVLQHHERLSGRGYPYGLSGSALNLFGRIAAIADCYDAMTTRRPYQRAYTPYEALFQITKEVDNYDRNVLETFIRMLGKVGVPEKPRAEAVSRPQG